MCHVSFTHAHTALHCVSVIYSLFSIFYQITTFYRIYHGYAGMFGHARLSPADRHILVLLALAPPLSLVQPLHGDLVHLIVLDAQLTPLRPKVAAVTDDANVERVRRAAARASPFTALPDMKRSKPRRCMRKPVLTTSRRVLVAPVAMHKTSHGHRVS